MSRQHLQRLLKRYREGGLDALEPRSRRPRTTPQATSDAVRERVIELRTELTGRGLDAGPVTIAWHLGCAGVRVPSTSTIRRILHQAGLITPEPRKRPRSSYVRFEAAQPNELWQSDFTHWRLADGTEVEIINWLDDHSRYLLGCQALGRVTGDDAVSTFLAAVEEHGAPVATLTDNAAVYTRASPVARTGSSTCSHSLACAYNDHRPHRATGRTTPGVAYRARPKAQPAGSGAAAHYRLRYDLTDRNGAITFRRAGRLHHLRIGAAHARRRVLALADDSVVTVIALDTGEVLSVHHIEPDRAYWRNQQRSPGRWPRSP